ncbi:MAG: hypothetical protein M3162_01975 [Thermoproteota archaeon]|nr:hypothetical protein [Thermoproteota archaeon]
MSDLIGIIKDLKNLSVSNKEKMLLLKIINNQYKLPNTKFKKIKELFRVLGKTYGQTHQHQQKPQQRDGDHQGKEQLQYQQQHANEEKSLIEKGLIEKPVNYAAFAYSNNPTSKKHPAEMLEGAVLERDEGGSGEGEGGGEGTTQWQRHHQQQQQQQQQRQFKQNYRITSKGLIHIFGGNYIYSPEFLLIYENDIVLQKILYQFFLPNTIKSATARFFSIVTEYLSSVSKYLQNFSNDVDNSSTWEKITDEIEFNLRIHSYLLGYKVAVMFNDSSIFSSSQHVKDEKTMLVIYELENNMKKTLSKDDKFKNFLGIVNDEFSNGHKEIINQDR